MTHVNFLNKNRYRKYPLRQSADPLSLLGSDLFVSCRVTTTVPNIHKAYLKKVVTNNGVVSASVFGIDGSSVEYYLGSFTGLITRDNQVIALHSSVNNPSSGTITVGSYDTANLTTDAAFDPNTGALETTCVSYMPKPIVSSVKIVSGVEPTDSGLLAKHYQTVTGDVSTLSTTITFSTIGSSVGLDVNTPSTILSKQDKTVWANNCDSPNIYSIAGVTPNLVGNIDIYGITPVVIAVDGVLGTIGIATPSFSRADLCAGSAPNNPPSNKTNTYYGDIRTVTTPEWGTWPQYKNTP